MNTTHADGASRSYWFVGADYGNDKQKKRFIKEEIWENGNDDKFLDRVRSMRPGDRIAIKSVYTRKNELPFDNRGESVSVMNIEVIGTITENLGDGRRVRVKWTNPERSPRAWYFSTYWKTVHRVRFGEDWKKDGLIEFAFENKPQDIDRFLNTPPWRGRYGMVPGDQRFPWTKFYEAVAEKLLAYQDDRGPLIEGIHGIGARVKFLSYLQDHFADGRTGPLTDICPFTAIGTFNRSMTDINRRTIAKEVANLLGVDLPAPDSFFPGIPVLNPQKSWFFGYSKDRDEGDIDALWDTFAAALRFIHSDEPKARAELIETYDRALGVRGVAWNLSMAFYWACPWDFVPLDERSRKYISNHLGLSIPTRDQTRPGNAESYLQVLDELKARFEDESCPVHSFPELSLAAWNYGQTENGQGNGTIETYSITDVLNEGCFLERGEIERLLERLRTRKNLILQGPPGTGKTWLAKRLAFALIGERDEAKVRAVQFHPNLSYEDFVRGWRPIGDGKLALTDGVFMEMIRNASGNSSANFVLVIEEINRGNPAQIFGELLTLLEADKRSPRNAIELCYPDADGRRLVHIPENLYVIGTMNIADRSLALMDLAFRRRFAFVTLEPRLGDTWRNWVVQESGIDASLVGDIERRITKLNERIAGEPGLGSQFRIGHSYVTPTHPLESGATKDWFRQVVETEIGPLLEEYWFDSPDSAKKAIDELIEGW